MTRRGIRSTVQRFVVVAGMAVAVLGGSVALGPPSDASAAPIHCALAELDWANYEAYKSAGQLTKAYYHLGRYSTFSAQC